MAETAEQIETRLTNVRAAIERAILAASYSVASRSHSNQQLKELRAYERQLELKLSRMTNGGAVVLSDFSSPGDTV